MGRAARPGGLLALLLALTAACGAVGGPDRPLQRMNARNWDADARKQAESGAKAFLEEAGTVRGARGTIP